jgi:hypothetical protein
VTTSLADPARPRRCRPELLVSPRRLGPEVVPGADSLAARRARHRLRPGAPLQRS